MVEISKIIDEKDFYRFIQLENLVEVSLRRNIFTHNDGKVNKIYIDACTEYGIANDKKDGDKLILDGDYFVKLYDTYFDFGVKITYFTLIHHCDTEERYDTAANFVNDKIFTLIKSDKNETAIGLANFILEGKYCKKLTESMRLYVLINKAIALKNIGKIDEKNNIIQSIDWSAKTNLFKLARAVLEENWGECAILMQKVATKERSEENIEELSDREWRLWPLFKDFRETKEFKSAYKIFYGKEYINALE